VLGKADSKLSRKYVCPVLLLACNHQTAMGSGRSVNHINIHQALSANAHLLDKFGGHAMASGLTLAPDRLKELESGLRNHLHTHYTPADFNKSLIIDAVLDMTDISLELARDLDRLRPFGTDNPEPLFLARDLKVISSQVIGRCHRKMQLQNAEDPTGPIVEAFHFNAPDPLHPPNFFSRLAFHLKLSKFKTDTPQMIIEDSGQ